MVKLRRGQLRRPNTIGASLNVTTRAKGLGKKFAPPWSLVKVYKNGTIDEAEYTKQYVELLDRVPVEIWRDLYRHGRDEGTITMYCFCHASAKLCHSYILVAYAAAKYSKGFEVHEELTEYIEGLDYLKGVFGG